MVLLRYHKGTILVRGNVRVPNSTWDPHFGAFRTLAIYYPEVLQFLRLSKVSFKDDVLNLLPCPDLASNTILRDYQAEALEAWIKGGNRGVIVLPTGAGKTIVAIAAISHVNAPTLVAVPTIDLMEQWRTTLEKEFKVEIGAYGGGETSLQAITVSTYDSAYLRAEELGDKFILVIFDEVHHLPAPSYSQIAELFAAPFRLGLTATYFREDEGHKVLPRLVGNIVYELETDDLAGTHLSHYTLEKMLVNLTPVEQAAYEENYAVFLNFLRWKRIKLRSARDFQRFIMRTGSDPRAREALLARNKALDIALNSSNKIKALKRLLARSSKKKVLIFTQHNKLVYRISREFLIPAITHQTPKEERSEILGRFKSGAYQRIVTSRVLDEGIDVPDATIGIILSGTGSSREFIQRLGRLLRKKKGKRARLVEIVSNETREIGISKRRRR
ncbi:MAG: DEAD/DEAH box helicase family protein [Candidatus Bathyarchaeota archaeon]|nr:MAG: DEAD/DEAH box helicase family protein [Candidatus Bathyarchaeota archaeon]